MWIIIEVTKTARLGEAAGVIHMTDKIMKEMEGRWFLQYSGCPMWKSGNIDTISFNYTLEHRGEELVLKDVVEYRKNGRMRVKSGIDIPGDDGRTFQWRGIGVGSKLFRGKSRVLLNEDGILVIWFERTLGSQESIDVLTRKRHLTSKESEYILSILEKSEEYSRFIGNIDAVNIG